jgi:Putative beta barrel porin-7 (BBP7)
MVPPFPGPAGTPPVMAQPQTGAPPPPPFGMETKPPAVAPPGPDRPANGFSDPVPPDAENGFECNPQPECVPNRPYFFSIDYIHWWVQKQPTPPLVTTGNATDNFPGALGQPSTEVVIGHVSDGGAHDGARVLFGYDFDAQGCLGFDVSGFWLDNTAPTGVAAGNGNGGSMVLTRPFFNVNTHAQDADPINIPGVMGGQFIASTPVRLAGADADLRYLVNPSSTNGPRLTLLFGINYIDLDEKLVINEFLTDTPGLGAAGNHYTIYDNFTTYNRFYGGQLGAQTDIRVGPVVMIFVGKCAFGRTEETLEISGSTNVIEANGAVANNPKAGLYAGPGNVGHYDSGEFAVVPQGQFKLAYEFNQYVRMDVGYDVFWISRVIRPGDQVNTNINVQPIGGPPVAPLEPSFLSFRSSGLWAQGFNFGLEVNF